MNHLDQPKITNPRTGRAALSAVRSARKSLALTKPKTTTQPTLGRPLRESARFLVKYMLVIFLTLVSFAVDGPVSWWGFEELTIALQRATGLAWNASHDVKWVFWLFVTVVSTLSLAHFTLNWREYGRGWRGFIKGIFFVSFILAPSQIWDFVDSTAGIYGLFQPIDLAAINPALLYISIAGAIFGSFVAPTFVLLLAKEGNTPHATKGKNRASA